jgi:hypothetical protein
MTAMNGNGRRLAVISFFLNVAVQDTLFTRTAFSSFKAALDRFKSGLKNTFAKFQEHLYYTPQPERAELQAPHRVKLIKTLGCASCGIF